MIPTAWAYEQACKALRARHDELRALRDYVRRQHAVMERLSREGFRVGYRQEIRALLAEPIPAPPTTPTDSMED